MDDQSDSRYSRAPELKDLIQLCRSLNEQGAKYILIGGFAVILQGFVRGTKDIDLLVDPAKENVRRIKKALSNLPDNAASQMADDEIAKYEIVRVADEIVVDLMAKACGIDYEQAKNGIEFKQIGEIAVPVAKKELLMQMKQTLRPADQMDVEFLKYRLEEEKK